LYYKEEEDTGNAEEQPASNTPSDILQTGRLVLTGLPFSFAGIIYG
jgi:hypothetical protein